MLMPSLSVGPAFAAVLSTGVIILIAKKMNMTYYLNWLLVHARYNIMATKEIVIDKIQAKCNRTELPLMPDRVAIVTGGSRGIGLEVVKMLLQCDMQVIIACRNVKKGDQAVENIRKACITTGKPMVMELDNSKLDSVKKFVEQFKKLYDRLDILVNNAGIMFTPYAETAEGFEQQYGVNYLSHFYLTLALLTPLKKAACESGVPSRIVNVSSCAHLLGKINFDDLNNKKNFNTEEAYAQSKLAQLMFTKKLARMFDSRRIPIIVNAVHPGMVNTDLFEHTYVRHLQFAKDAIFKTPQEGATTIVFAAVDPKIENRSGMYLRNCIDAPVNRRANDLESQDRLFKLSLQQAQIKNFSETF